MNTPLGYISNNVAMVNDYLLDIQSIIDSIGTIESTHKISKNNLIVELKKIIGKYRGYELSERQRETLDLLEDSDNGLKEMSQLVSSLKDFSRLDKKQVDEVDIHQGLESTLKISNNIIKHNNVTLQLEYSDLPTVKCNPSKINQVFLNIITNACQAMIDGGTLTIKTAKQGNNISILFKDSGVGMDKETQKNIFDPFYTTKEIGKGTGLGMSISYKIINEHKGRIEVESQLGIGTSITVVLPIG
jgi:signal transduction histidine kinase